MFKIAVSLFLVTILVLLLLPLHFFQANILEVVNSNEGIQLDLKDKISYRLIMPNQLRVGRGSIQVDSLKVDFNSLLFEIDLMSLSEEIVIVKNINIKITKISSVEPLSITKQTQKNLVSSKSKSRIKGILINKFAVNIDSLQLKKKSVK